MCASSSAVAGYPLLKAEMLNRVAYPEAGIEGLSPSITDPDGAAARDIAAIAQELMKLENHEFMKEGGGMTSKKLGAFCAPFLLRLLGQKSRRNQRAHPILAAAEPLLRPAGTRRDGAEVPLQVLIPEHIRKQLAVKAAEEGRSLRALILRLSAASGSR